MGRLKRHIETRGRQTDIFEFNPDTKKLLEEKKKKRSKSDTKKYRIAPKTDVSDTIQKWYNCRMCGKEVPAPLVFCSTDCKEKYTRLHPVRR